MTIKIRDSFVDMAGGSIFVRHWHRAPAAGSPIILLHDSLGCVEMWRDFPAALAEAADRDVIAYDRLGFGRSSRRTDLPSIDFIDQEAESCFPAIRRGLGIDRFSLFGHSVGGAMALRIAASEREACEAVITESAQAFVEMRTLAGIRDAKATFANPEQFTKLTKWHGEKARWVLDAWTEVWLSPEFSSWSLDPHLSQIGCPVLAIHGDSDEYGSEAFPRRIVSQVAAPSRLAILDHCGHVPHRERRDDVLRLSASFLSEHASKEQ